MDGKKIPSIRFQGYEEQWEQCKLDSLVNRIQRKNLNNESTLPLTISSQDGLVDQSTYFNKRIASRDVSNYYLILNGEFAYNKSSSEGFPFGSIKRLDLYEKGVLSTLYIVFAINDQQTVDSDFLTVLFDSDKWHKEVSRRATEGARNHGLLNISAVDFLDIDLHIPRSKTEQRLVAIFLRDIGNLIALHRNKLEKLIQVKKSMLEKLFAHDDSYNPAIRCGVYNKQWEVAALRDILRLYSDFLTTPKEGYTRLGIRSHMNGTFYEYVAPTKRLGEKRLQRVKKDNLIVNIVFAWEHAIAITTEEDEGKLVSHRFPQFSFVEGMYPRFFHYALNDERFRHHLWLASPSGAGRNKTLRIDEMLEYKLRIPCYEEQKQIADFMDSLENLIDLYGQKLEQLQHIKSALLDKMFVS